MGWQAQLLLTLGTGLIFAGLIGLGLIYQWQLRRTGKIASPSGSSLPTLTAQERARLERRVGPVVDLHDLTLSRSLQRDYKMLTPAAFCQLDLGEKDLEPAIVAVAAKSTLNTDTDTALPADTDTDTAAPELDISSNAELAAVLVKWYKLNAELEAGRIPSKRDRLSQNDLLRLAALPGNRNAAIATIAQALAPTKEAELEALRAERIRDNERLEGERKRKELQSAEADTLAKAIGLEVAIT